jgi:UDP-N-acetylglucosamine/UDP-N-acetylgalactosamine 4-epimerase
MSALDEVLSQLTRQPRHWLVTGAAGFIASNLVEFLLRHGQRVTGLDDFSTGHRHNLDEVRTLVGGEAWARFQFIEGSVARLDDCQRAVRDVELILHQGAIGSVPRSIEQPLETHAANVTGTLNLLFAAKEAGVPRFVYASSSSVYGDAPELPKVEDRIGNCLSPYAVSKLADELYADVFCRCYGLTAVGLRYFNVFGPRQDPNGAYAAVIPKWIAAFLEEQPIEINGDGETSRDFCHIANVVQANVLAAGRPLPPSTHAVYNIAVGERTTLNELFTLIQSSLVGLDVPASVRAARPVYRDFRAGDVRHSLADISAARRDLGYAPTHDVHRGMAETIAWYVADYQRRQQGR